GGGGADVVVQRPCGPVDPAGGRGGAGGGCVDGGDGGVDAAGKCVGGGDQPGGGGGARPGRGTAAGGGPLPPGRIRWRPRGRPGAAGCRSGGRKRRLPGRGRRCARRGRGTGGGRLTTAAAVPGRRYPETMRGRPRVLTPVRRPRCLPPGPGPGIPAPRAASKKRGHRPDIYSVPRNP